MKINRCNTEGETAQNWSHIPGGENWVNNST